MDKVVFFTTIKGDSEFYPIKKTNTHRFNWESRGRLERTEIDAMDSIERLTHYTKCPSFPLVNSLGALIYLPFDIDFKVNSDDTIQWNAPGKIFVTENPKFSDVKVLEWHTKHHLGESSSIIGDGVFKINTSWVAASTIPNLKMLMLPVMTPDQDIFTASGGALDLDRTASFMNVQGHIRGNFTNYTLKAGTPIAQVIPLTDKKVQFEVRYAEAHDRELVEDYLYIVMRGLGRNEKQKLAQKVSEKWRKVETGATNVFRRKANNIYRNTKNWLQKRGDSVS